MDAVEARQGKVTTRARERKACLGSTEVLRSSQIDSNCSHLNYKVGHETSVPRSHVDGHKVSTVTVHLHHVMAKRFLSAVEMLPFCPWKTLGCDGDAQVKLI